jgi:hypothetical protein
MMKLLVNTLPKTSSECPFAIKCHDNFFSANCKLKMNSEYDWQYLSFSNGSCHPCCSLDKEEECPHLMTIQSMLKGGEAE